MLEEHKGSRETYEFIASWIRPDFFFSVKDRWDRFGFLGVFADYVCCSVGGDIAEIGVGESSIYLTHVARKYNRRSYHCDVAASKIINPLTIPGYLFRYPVDNLDIINRDMIKQVEQENHLIYIGASDEFFKMVNMTPMALAFIDGDHIYEQAAKDFWNFVPRMVDNGFIVLHDTYPPSEEYLKETACGGVWQLRRDIEQDPRFDCLTLTRGTAIGVGLTIVRVKPKERPFYNE